jgi:hypothetical protein
MRYTVTFTDGSKGAIVATLDALKAWRVARETYRGRNLADVCPSTLRELTFLVGGLYEPIARGCYGYRGQYVVDVTRRAE